MGTIWELFGNYAFSMPCLPKPPKVLSGTGVSCPWPASLSKAVSGHPPESVCGRMNLTFRKRPLSIIPLGRISADRHALINELASRRWLVCGFFGHVFANGRDVRRQVLPDCLLLASQMPESKTAVLSSWQRACTHSGTLPADQAASQPTSQPARQ